MIRSSSARRARVDADVCVIGAGAAGLTLARELAGSRLRVVVLESGGRAPPPARDPVYDFRYTRDKVSHDSRVRGLGGTTRVWAGRWKRFDPIDLAPRDWVPRSGWPIAYDALVPYYARAEAAIGIREEPAFATSGPVIVSTDAIEPVVFYTQPEAERDWGALWAERLDRADNVEVLLDTHVVELARDGRRVARVACVAGDGAPVTVAARDVVIAAGGIENARLLLLSKLGNDHDQVGRYYMDHPKAKIGVVEPYRAIAFPPLAGLSEAAPVYLGYRLSDAVQRRERVLNSQVFVAPQLETGLVSRLVRRARTPAHCHLLVLREYLEQVPDPDNRVFLVDEPDPFGRAKAGVQWTTGELDRRTIVVFHRLLRDALQQAGVGELHSPLVRDPVVFPPLADASHPMGTTRMGSDPRSSVVDAQCRVHDLDNLYVAGSSVFATSGYANPTATIAALAIRLADHLAGKR